MAYLYGASVQGIQEFIFATNKLKEIVGASEIVKGISDKLIDYNPDSILVNAAGNIKAVFKDKASCEKIVNNFTKDILMRAYGITISQAVVEFDSDYPTPDDFNDLEKKLKIQRNKKSIDLDLSLNIFELAPSTARPVVKKVKVQKKETPIDKATHQKREANNKDELYNDISELANSNNKIAIIHADGNGLGKLVPTLGKKLSSFSKNLDSATKEAFELAQTKDMKIRKVILGGDDMTVICDADNALEFTKNYLKYFEEQTQKMIPEIDGYLTACAGITYCNKSYPFHYGVTLAEELCSTSKDISNREHSCLLFHNIQSSNVESYEKFIEDELTIDNGTQKVLLNYGPYYVHEKDGVSIQNIQNLAGALSIKNSPKASLRQWLSQLYINEEYAKNMIERIDEMADLQPDYDKEILNKNFKVIDENLSLKTPIINGKTPIYDVLQLLSVTKESK